MKLIKLASLLTLALSVTACVTGTREISLEVPVNQTQATKKSGAIYIASIEDKRAFEKKPKKPETPSVSGKLEKKTAKELNTYIGRQRNGYGGAMGSVALADGASVQDEVRQVLISSLQSRGYTIADNPTSAQVIDVDIEKFWAWMVPSFVSTGFESEVSLKLDANGKSSTATARGNNEGQIASNANWALTYKRAYQALFLQLESAFQELGL